MRPMARWTAVAAAALALTGCATTMNVSAYVGRGVNFSQYRTYDWGPADALPTGDPRLDNNGFFIDLLEGAIEKIESCAKRIVTAISDGDMLRSQLAIVRRLGKHEPFNTIALRQTIAQRMIEAGKYVIA